MIPLAEGSFSLPRRPTGAGVAVYRFIEQEKANHSVKRMCRVLEVSKSGYYAWRERPPSARSIADTELLTRIKTIHEESRGIYGAPAHPRRAQAQASHLLFQEARGSAHETSGPGRGTPP